jgi:hypothetical protein
MHTYDDDADLERVEFDFSRATRAKGPRFPEGFEIRIDDATGYSLRLIPSNKVLARFTSTRDAWPPRRGLAPCLPCMKDNVIS